MHWLTIMLEAGFVHHPNAWWHYQLPDAIMTCVPALQAAWNLL